MGLLVPFVSDSASHEFQSHGGLIVTSAILSCANNNPQSHLWLPGLGMEPKSLTSTITLRQPGPVRIMLDGFNGHEILTCSFRINEMTQVRFPRLIICLAWLVKIDTNNWSTLTMRWVRFCYGVVLSMTCSYLCLYLPLVKVSWTSTRRTTRFSTDTWANDTLSNKRLTQMVGVRSLQRIVFLAEWSVHLAPTGRFGVFAVDPESGVTCTCTCPKFT